MRRGVSPTLEKWGRGLNDDITDETLGLRWEALGTRQNGLVISHLSGKDDFGETLGGKGLIMKAQEPHLNINKDCFRIFWTQYIS